MGGMRTPPLRDSTRRFVALAACLAAIVSAPACQQETHARGIPEIRMIERKHTTVADAKILRDGETVGSLRTLRVQTRAGDRTVRQVRDLRQNALGFIDESNCAYRHTAHRGSELVGNSAEVSRNVAAILGAFGSTIEIVDETPASVVEKR